MQPAPFLHFFQEESGHVREVIETSPVPHSSIKGVSIEYKKEFWRVGSWRAPEGPKHCPRC